MLITGDFFVTPPRTVFDLEASLRGVAVDNVDRHVAEFFAAKNVGSSVGRAARLFRGDQRRDRQLRNSALKQLMVVQHTSADYLGLMEDHLEARRIRFQYFRPFANDGKLPDRNALGDGLILLGGGPWGSAGGRDVPNLDAEVGLARVCLMVDKPVIGIGLGAQILSIAADGKTSAAPLAFQVGYATRKTDDALNGYLPPRHPHVVFMRDRPEPPAYARILSETR